MKARLFIGNLASTVTEEELKGKFDALLASHQGEAEVGNVEVRCKNENNYFGFVDVHLNSQPARDGVQTGGGRNTEIPIFLRKYIDLMNNTKWKGSLIKVQLAKESFIEKLRREQQENQKSETFSQNGANYAQNGRKYDGASQTKNTNEGNDSEQSRNQRQANDILHKLNRSKERRRRSDFEEDRNNAGTKKDSGDCGFEVVSSDAAAIRNKSPKSSPVKSSHPSPKKEEKKHVKKSKSNSSSSSEEESDDDVRDGIPKFKGLLFCYPDGLPAEKQPEPKVTATSEENIPEPEETQIQQKLLSIAFENDRVKRPQKDKPIPSASNTNKSAINFKKNKQQQSDLLRLQSIEKMKELNTQRKNVIKSALSSVTASAPVSEQRKILGSELGGEEEEPTCKKSKMSLFGDEDDSDEEQGDDDNDNEDAFKVKKQFEGVGGQKLLELKTRWGNDDRFKIDDRFKDSDAEQDSVEPMEQEKEKQYDILTGILGKVVSSKTTAAPSQKKSTSTKGDKLASVIMPRYDPEAEENEVHVEDEQKIEEDKQSVKSKKEKKNGSTDGVLEKSIRSTEPATFKTVSNLKALFSSSADDNDAGKENTTTPLFKAPPVVTQPSSFSLLATFGKSGGHDDGDDKSKEKSSTATSKSSSKSAEGPRTFWQSNPFRYDSSDDEGEGDKVKVTIKDKPEKPVSSGLVIHGKTPFFFTENDPRFNGLEDYFLRYEESSSTDVKEEGGADGAEVKKEPIEDFALKRQELKSIVKAKIRNTKRKDEKRTLAIKRAIRKRKSKVRQRGRNNFS